MALKAVKAKFHVFVCTLLLAAARCAFSQDIQRSESFGGPHGTEFSDEAMVTPGQTVRSLTLHVGERPHGLQLDISAPTAKTFSHGGSGGSYNTLALGAGEYIVSMEAHWGKHKGKTRIFYLNFVTNSGNSVSGGSMTDAKATVTAPEGFQLAGFFGRDGDNIDLLGVVWARLPAPVTTAPPATTQAPATTAPPTLDPNTSVEATDLSEQAAVYTPTPTVPVTPEPTPAPTPAPVIKDPTLLSESFGGPHGSEYTDEPVVKSGQIVTTLTLRVGERTHGIQLDISAPVATTLTHGGPGGNFNTLTLGPGEYIVSMEAHWGKHKGRTRIFYLNFATNLGNSVSGGSMTDSKGTVTAPEGYQLGGFFGRDGGELDLLGVVWSSIDKVTPAPVVQPSGSSAGTTQTIKTAVVLSEVFGGPHGNQFSDQPAARSGQTVNTLTLRVGERTHGIQLDISAPIAASFSHGGPGGNFNTLTLGPGEYIVSMEAHWGKHKGRTRIFYLNFATNLGNSVSGGSMTDSKGIVTAPEGYQLGGFFGRDGDELDRLGVVWTSIEKVVEYEVEPDADILLSEVFGGPHGIAFSDITNVKFGQTVSSITLNVGERSHGLTLQVSAPEQKTFNHGGSGGEEKTLTLAPGEYITSMEAHWGKKNDRTRVFHLNFGTSAGNSISGGMTTNDKKTITAPEGFQLGGFFGRAEREIDQIGVIWTRIGVRDLQLTDAMQKNGTHTISIRNWVGPTIGDPTDTACYRKTKELASNKDCPLGYGRDGSDCIAQCPLSYPVSCGLECIPQNDDCASNVLMKIGSVAYVALNALTGGVMGEVLAAFKYLRWGIACAAQIISVVRSLVYYLRYQQTAAPQGDVEQLLAVAYQADVVLIDLPRAVCVCMGLPVPKGTDFADTVLQTVEGIVKQAITNGDMIVSTGKNVLNLLTGSGAMTKPESTVDELQDLVDKNSSCGYELKRLTDRVVDKVLDIRNKTPDTSLADTRVIVYKSELALNDIPTVTNNCMGELLSTKTAQAAFQTRDLLRKTFGVIIDQLIDTGKTDLGKDVAEQDYMLQVANMGLVALSVFDPTGIASMAHQFVQPICGPTGYLGEIDDGNLYDALGLTTVDEAFEGSYGTWTNSGDGVVQLIFESTDTKDVTVVIHSGGEDYSEVDVGAGNMVTWTATIPELQDKQMYLDRWRPGIMGLPGSGGGSLLLWIPRASQGGHITMHVRINVS